ncbi:uncharacterized protein JCM6883_003156 [Sporobolomyces salmoneus]|uniref:uncharacterized protein n=1 Tax=Sporobolomyces salmoneus TaxID=183962 RepID=UPI0031756E8D
MTSPNQFHLLLDQSSDEDDLAAIEQYFSIDSDQAEDSDEPQVHKLPSGGRSSSHTAQTEASERLAEKGFERSEERGNLNSREAQREALFREAGSLKEGSADDSRFEGEVSERKEQREDPSSTSSRSGQLNFSFLTLPSRYTTHSYAFVRYIPPPIDTLPESSEVDRNNSPVESLNDEDDLSTAHRRAFEEIETGIAQLPIESQLAWRDFVANLDETMTVEQFVILDERRQQTAAYLADETNYERLLGQEGGFGEIVRENVKREGTGYRKGQLHAIFTAEQPTRIVIRPLPGTATSHLAFLVRIINLAAGGFFFLTSACESEAFWTSFFPIIMPFFEAGGHGLLALPVGDLSSELLAEERSWQQTIEERTSGRLRFVFVGDGDQYVSWDITEGLVVAPGGEMVDVQMSENFNSCGLATAKPLAPDSASAASRLGSSERMTVYRLHFEEAEGLKHVQDLGSFWSGLAQDDSLIYNVPWILDFLGMFLFDRDFVFLLRRAES